MFGEFNNNQKSRTTNYNNQDNDNSFTLNKPSSKKNDDDFLLVNAEVLPEVFTKVIQAKKFLARGEAKNLSQAAEMANLSRSALYRYKDNVFIYNDSISHGIISLNIILRDEPGILSLLLASFSRFGLNILTINQTIPVDGVAAVSLSAQIIHQNLNISDVIDQISAISGIVKIKQIKG